MSSRPEGQRSGGDCFQSAFNCLLEEDRPGMQMVHGECILSGGPKEGQPYSHAWCEYEVTLPLSPQFESKGFVPPVLPMVLDKSNGNNIDIPAVLYYNAGQVGETFRYTKEEACILTIRSMHFGPWELETEL